MVPALATSFGFVDVEIGSFTRGLFAKEGISNCVRRLTPLSGAMMFVLPAGLGDASLNFRLISSSSSLQTDEPDILALHMRSALTLIDHGNRDNACARCRTACR